MKLFRIASVHGRFQPLHNGHIRYIRAALEKSHFLHIGITQFELSHLERVAGAGEHRQSEQSNPLTYFERAQLLDLALEELGVGRNRYRIEPFPLERPEELQQFLPSNIPVLTTRVEEWNDRKTALLEKHGYRVVVLYTLDTKDVSGSHIRELMAIGDPLWMDLVPRSTHQYLQELDLAPRLT